MAVAEDERTNEGQDQQDGSGTRTALKAAAAAAATGAATLAVRKALSHDSGGDRSSRSGDDRDENDGSGSKQSPGSMLSTVASSAWESASEVVLPMADEAVAAAGRYLAESAPDVVRDRFVPKFIDAFNEAK